MYPENEEACGLNCASDVWGVKGMAAMTDYRQRKLGYPCIFAETIDEASANLIRVLILGDCDFSEGSAYWLACIQTWLGSNQPLTGLNFSGAPFNDTEWHLILGKVAEALRQHLRSP